MHHICQEQFCRAQACIPLFAMSIKFIAQNGEGGGGYDDTPYSCPKN